MNKSFAICKHFFFQFSIKKEKENWFSRSSDLLKLIEILSDKKKTLWTNVPGSMEGSKMHLNPKICKSTPSGVSAILKKGVNFFWIISVNIDFTKKCIFEPFIDPEKFVNWFKPTGELIQDVDGRQRRSSEEAEAIDYVLDEGISLPPRSPWWWKKGSLHHLQSRITGCKHAKVSESRRVKNSWEKF